jgi:hypothetical protein
VSYTERVPVQPATLKFALVPSSNLLLLQPLSHCLWCVLNACSQKGLGASVMSTCPKCPRQAIPRPPCLHTALRGNSIRATAHSGQAQRTASGPMHQFTACHPIVLSPSTTRWSGRCDSRCTPYGYVCGAFATCFLSSLSTTQARLLFYPLD